MRERQCEIDFAVEDARFARGVGHGGEGLSSCSLRLSAPSLIKDVIDELEGELHPLEPEVPISI